MIGAKLFYIIRCSVCNSASHEKSFRISVTEAPQTTLLAIEKVSNITLISILFLSLLLSYNVLPSQEIRRNELFFKINMRPKNCIKYEKILITKTRHQSESRGKASVRSD